MSHSIGIAMRVFWAVTAIVLAGALMSCGQGPKGDAGPPGPPGAKGDPGPLGPVMGVRVVRSPCDVTTCTMQCEDGEILLTAYLRVAAGCQPIAHWLLHV